MAVNWYDGTCIHIIHKRIESSLSVICYFLSKPKKEEVELSDFIIVVDMCHILLV